jgi:regulatory protein
MYSHAQRGNTYLISKYSEATPSNYKEKAKQQRFLQSRGFGFDEIKCSFEP